MTATQTEQQAEAPKSAEDYLPENVPGQKNNASETETESTAVDDNPTTHTAEETAKIEEYKAAVDENVKNGIERARSLKNMDYRNKFFVTLAESVGNRVISLVKEATGIDITGFRNEIKGNSIAHIDNRHGANGVADHSMANIDDFSRINYVVENADRATMITEKDVDAETWKLSREYRNADNTQAPLIRFEKRVDNTYYVVEAVPDSKAHRMAVVSAYMEKVKTEASSPKSVDATEATPRATPEASLEILETSADTNVPENGGNVKGKTDKNGFQKSTIKAIKSTAEENRSTIVVASDTNGQKYIITSGLVLAISDKAYNNATKNPKGVIPEKYVGHSNTTEQALKAFDADEYQKVTEPPTEALTKDGKTLVVFKGANGENVYFNKNFISELDGGEFYLNADPGKKYPQIKAVDANGNVIGYALPFHVEAIDESTIKPTNLKAFANDAQNAAEATNAQEGVNTQANAENANSGQNTALNSNDTQTAPKTGADALFETVTGSEESGVRNEELGETAQGQQQGTPGNTQEQGTAQGQHV